MGEKPTVTPAGIPLTVNVTGELNPAVSVSVKLKLVLDPRATVADVGLSLRVKLGGAATVTTSDTVWVTLPPFAVMVMVWLPTAALVAALKVRTLVPEPGAARLAGEKLAVMPAGTPFAATATAELNAVAPVTVKVT